ncbi:MAG: tetratricopeptide repeat protein, partial [Alphaproteobacteria bacterium]|nr:tetratricopeptide repeat protein [Alphaproteobacteria bacterium]
LEQAFMYFMQGAEKGDTLAQYRYAVLLAKKREYAQAIYWYQQAAAKGHAGAQVNLGIMHMEGRGLPVDWREALRCFEENSENAKALYYMGVIFQEAKGGVEKNIPQAIACLEKAAQKGFSAAYTRLGYIYASKDERFRDYPKAMDCLTRAADLGETQACLSMSGHYYVGKEVAKNDAKAHQYLIMITQDMKGPEQAHFLRGLLESSGKGGFNRNIPSAIRHLNNAKGLWAADCVLGVFKKAQKVLKQTQDRGDAHSLFMEEMVSHPPEFFEAVKERIKGMPFPDGLNFFGEKLQDLEGMNCEFVESTLKSEAIEELFLTLLTPSTEGAVVTVEKVGALFEQLIAEVSKLNLAAIAWVSTFLQLGIIGPVAFCGFDIQSDRYHLYEMLEKLLTQRSEITEEEFQRKLKHIQVTQYKEFGKKIASSS